MGILWVIQKCTKGQLTAMTLLLQTDAVDLEFTALELLVKKLPQCGHWFMGRQCGKAEKPPLKL